MDATPLDIDAYLALPRVGSLALSPRGDRLVGAIATLTADGKKFATALWEFPLRDDPEPRRLTRPTPGDAFGAFLPDGSVLFTSRRTADGGVSGDDEPTRLWLLPAAGGEARVVAEPDGGVRALRTARDAGTVSYLSPMRPWAADPDADAAAEKARTDAGVTARLYDDWPVRYWDHYLGPRRARLFAAAPPAGNDGCLVSPRDLTPDAGTALDDPERAAWELTPDGGTAIATWRTVHPGGRARTALVAIDVASGSRRIVVSGDDLSFEGPKVSRDGRSVAALVFAHGTPERAMKYDVAVYDIATGEGGPVATDLDFWPNQVWWAHDDRALLATGDLDGEVPVGKIDVATGKLTVLTAAGSYSDVCVAPDGSAIYALRSALDALPEVVQLDPDGVEQEAVARPTPGAEASATLPGRVESFVAQAADGTEVQSWIVLPPGASAETPAPLAVYIHGGPFSAWGAWSWRWNPQLLAARGYAVVLPNPALSTGFGNAFVQRGWGRWGAEPFTDLMAAVDAAVARPDIDETRTAALGPSFGGFMANWVATHTNRFLCIVNHAGIWSLDQFHGTTDEGMWWQEEFGDPDVDATRYIDNSPSRSVTAIETPMLVIHGQRDERVPIGEAHALWNALIRYQREAKLLLFPDENHWILKPPNIRVWHEAVFGWLDHYVLGQEWERPGLL